MIGSDYQMRTRASKNNCVTKTINKFLKQREKERERENERERGKTMPRSNSFQIELEN